MKRRRVFLPILVVTMFLLMGCAAVTSALELTETINQLQEPAAADVQAATPAPLTVSQESISFDTVAAYQGALASIYEEVNPSVVNVDVATTIGGVPTSPFGFNTPLPQQQGTGSGFVWDTEGHIVTNNHVVEGADEIVVTFADGTIAEASVVGTDPNSDLAVIKVDVPADQLHPIRLMDSDQVRVGDLAIAIGNPYGLSGTMTTGIISGLSRSLPVDLELANTSGARYSIPDIIQTDASINPGNSGGVLVNAQGELIGVTTAIQSTTGSNAGIGFVIPANIVRRVVPVLIEEGEYQHTWLGITGTTLTPSIAEAVGLPEDQRGALVISLVPGGPAEKAGLRGGGQDGTGGDVIIAIDEQPVQRFEDMVSYLYNKTEVGQEVTLTVLRQGEEMEIEVVLGALPRTR